MINMKRLEELEKMSPEMPITEIINYPYSVFLWARHRIGLYEICVCGRIHANDEDRIRHKIRVEEDGKLYDSEYLNDSKV